MDHPANESPPFLSQLLGLEAFPPAAGTYFTTSILQWAFSSESFWRTPDMATVLDIAKSIALVGWKDASLTNFMGGCEGFHILHQRFHGEASFTPSCCLYDGNLGCLPPKFNSSRQGAWFLPTVVQIDVKTI